MSVESTADAIREMKPSVILTRQLNLLLENLVTETMKETRRQVATERAPFEKFDSVKLYSVLLHQPWQIEAEIVPNYMPLHPGPDTRPRCVVRFRRLFLRHSAGPRTGTFWDTYGDDFQTPELALVELSKAPSPFGIYACDCQDKEVSETPLSDT